MTAQCTHEDFQYTYFWCLYNAGLLSYSRFNVIQQLKDNLGKTTKYLISVLSQNAIFLAENTHIAHTANTKIELFIYFKLNFAFACLDMRTMRALALDIVIGRTIIHFGDPLA